MRILTPDGKEYELIKTDTKTANSGSTEGVNTPTEFVSSNSIPTSGQNVKEVFGFEIREGAVVNEDLLEELSIHDPDAAVD